MGHVYLVDMTSGTPIRADVRAHDYGRYCCALFAPPSAQPALLAILAFALEVGRVRSRVREPAMGEICLIWWRDAIDRLFAGAATKHPVTDALARPVANYGLSRDHFVALIAGNLEALQRPEAAAETDAAGVAPLRLWLEVLGSTNDAAVHAVQHVGRAWMLARSGAQELAMEELGAARAMRRDVPRAALPALLPAVLAQRALRRGREDTPGLWVPLSLAQAALFGRY